MYSRFAVPPPYPEESIRPLSVFFFKSSMKGITFLLKEIPGTRSGFAKLSERIIITVLLLILFFRESLSLLACFS